VSDTIETAGTDVVVRDDNELAAMAAEGVILPGELHPSPFKYVMIAVILVVITAAEVGMYYLEGNLADWFVTVTLLVMAALKFVIVVSYYMHLKSDKKIFRRFFTIGIVGAGILYLCVLAALGIFQH
jgi:cytochrome c oxidase subunit 4